MRARRRTHTPMPRHCFAYGSLLCEDIMTAVTGLALHGEPATLTGYVRLAVYGEDYPGIVPAPDGVVTGKLYRDVPEVAWSRLDAFEGEMYERRRVQVRLAAGGEAEAWVYVVRPEFRHCLAATEWDYEAFLREGKARFLARHVGFDTVHGSRGSTLAHHEKIPHCNT